ncbi:MAG: transporter substrate-binding domain-containing protein [Colwellia sp.]|nr:transporter substrate-binding domain-containing protein [Colwellia sp.]
MFKIPYILFVAWIGITTSFICKAKDVISISTFEFPPEHSKTLPHQGVVSHIIELAFAQQGIKVQWQYYPIPRAFMMAKSGRTDATASFGYSRERIKGMYISDSIITSSTYFYHLKTTTFNWTKMKDLSGLRIGVTHNLNYGDDFNNAVKEQIFTVDSSQHDDLNFKKLLAGRIDIFPMTSGIAEYSLSTRFPQGSMEQITYHKKPVRVYDSYIYFPKTLPDSEYLLDQFNKGLKKLKEDGQYQKIMTNYQLGDYSKNRSTNVN